PASHTPSVDGDGASTVMKPPASTCAADHVYAGASLVTFAPIGTMNATSTAPCTNPTSHHCTPVRAPVIGTILTRTGQQRPALPCDAMKVDGNIGSDLRTARAQARDAEAAGYSGVWSSETSHDPFLPLLLAAENTSAVDLGTSIAVAFARNPMLL